MGNCLITQENIIKVVKTDGKVLEYKAPIKVHEVLSDFDGHAISDRLPVIQHLQPDVVMVSDYLYYLVPLPTVPAPRREKKKVRFADPEAVTCHEGGVVRIKLVITKKELEIMLMEGGISVDHLRKYDQEDKQQTTNEVEHLKGNGNFVVEEEVSLQIESIPE